MENTKDGKPEEILPVKEPQLSRRNFLQVIGVYTISVGAAGLLGCEPPPDEPNSSELVCMGYILVDSRKCQGCLTCMASCSLVNEGVASFSLARIQVSVDAFASYPNDVRISQCRQCEDPKCVEACPTGAMMVDEQNGNIRRVDPELCVGCGRCVKACPFEPERPMVVADANYDGRPRSRKCDLCLNAPYHFAPEGGGIQGVRTCEAICPMQAIQFSPVMPLQDGDEGYEVNLRNNKWKQLGFDVTL